MVDEIKPHSDVQSDDGGGFIEETDFPKVETPYDSIEQSPNGTRQVSPV